MARKAAPWAAAGVILVAALAVWGAWTAQLGRSNNLMTLQLEAERQRNFMELTSRVQILQGLMAKGLAAGSASQNMLYMGEVYRHTTAAVSNFMALPLPGPLSASTGKFLNQVGDFAYSVARNEAAGRKMTDQQRSELRRLQKEADALARQMQQIGAAAAQTGFRWTAVQSGGPVTANAAGWLRPPRGLPDQDQDQDQAPMNLLPGGFEQVGPQMDRLPVLTYDGPFSDHLQKRKPAMGGELLSEADARQRAMSYIPVGTAYLPVDSVQVNGPIPAFAFRFAPAAAAQGARPTDFTLTVEVTQAGGHLLSLLNARIAGNPTMDLERAKEEGLSYLEAHGFAGMAPTFGTAEDGFATVQYVAKHQGALAYPDQVKIRISLDNGEVVGFDASQYVMNHRERGALAKPAVVPTEAARALNPDLQVERVQMALIPTEAGDGEVLAYEFLGHLEDETFLVYVNAETGHEERILQMLLTEEGTLAL